MYNKVQLFVQKEYNIFFSQNENILGEILKGTKGVLDVSSFHFYSPSELNPSWFFSVPNLMDLTDLRVRCLRGRLMISNGQNRNSHYDIIAFYNHQRNAMYSPLRPRSKKRGKIRTLNVNLPWESDLQITRDSRKTFFFLSGVSRHHSKYLGRTSKKGQNQVFKPNNHREPIFLALECRIQAQNQH